MAARAGRPLVYDRRMKRTRPSFGELALLWLRGAAVGAAEPVPGVSGGTVALVTRIYPRLLDAAAGASEAAAALLRGEAREAGRRLRAVDWRFAAALAAGAVPAALGLAGVIDYLLTEHPVRTAAVFAGLMAGAVSAAVRMLRRPAFRHLAAAAAVGAAAFWGFGFRSEAVADPSGWAFFLAGAAGVCAFILPGVSGSFVLLAAGMYQPVIGAAAEQDLAALAALAGGMALGLGGFVRILRRLLIRWHDPLLAVMIGLMAGSFRILWPWPNGLGGENGAGAAVLGAPGPDAAVPVLLAAGCAAAVIAFDRWAARRSHDPGNSRERGRADGKRRHPF